MTLEAIKEVLEQSEGKWNGEDAGQEEANAMNAKDGLLALEKLEEALVILGLKDGEPNE